MSVLHPAETSPLLLFLSSCTLCHFGMLGAEGAGDALVSQAGAREGKFRGSCAVVCGGGVQGRLLVLTCASPCQHAAKQAAASATQTIAAAQHAASSNKNPAAQQQLVQSCKVRAQA